MINEQECSKILNDEGCRITKDDIKILRDLMVAFAQIEYDNFKKGERIK